MVAASGIGFLWDATYDSPLISLPPRTPSERERPRRRPRPGSLERPVNGRAYRSAWLFVALPLLIAALSVSRPAALSAPGLPPSFDGGAALALARDLARLYPDRSPGSAGALGATRWLIERFRVYGFEAQVDGFEAAIPGRGRQLLRNVAVVVPGRTPEAIVVMAHRDDTGNGTGANDNASGTAALVELARAYARPSTSPSQPVSPEHTILFLSTDGGAYGGLGARRFAEQSAYRGRVVAVVNLDSLAGTGPPRLEITGDQPRSPAPTLVETAAARIEERTGVRPGRTSMLGQLIDLGFPFSLYEQAPLVGRGIPAVTLTRGGNRPAYSFGDSPERLVAASLTDLGHAAQDLLSSLDEGLELARGTDSYLYLGQRFVRGWAIQLALIAMLVPFLIAAVDEYAFCRRRRIPLAPALRSYRSRAGLWLWAWLMFELLALAGAWPSGAAAPVNPESAAAGSWPVLGLLLLAALALPGWVVARARLVPTRQTTTEEELAGHAAAMLALGVVALLVVATNPFALLFVLPSLHAWIWLPNLRESRPLARLAAVLAGFGGPLLLLGSLAFRFGLGLDAPWYLAELAAIGYVSTVASLLVVFWLAGSAQVVAIVLGRYAPYPAADERPPRGPLRNLVRAVVLGVRARRRPAEPEREALEA